MLINHLPLDVDGFPVIHVVNNTPEKGGFERKVTAFGPLLRKKASFL
jgi:hypothetical protein